MKYIIILILIICFWFFSATMLTFIAADSLVTNFPTIENYSNTIDFETSDINITGGISEDSQVTAGDLIGMTVRMFTFRIPDFVPPALNFLINFFNYILLLVLAITIYRLIQGE